MVLSSLEVGGAEMTALELLRPPGPEGWEVCVAAIKGGAALKSRFEQFAAAVYTRIARFKGDPLGLWRMAWIIRRERIDAVIVADAPRDGMFYAFVGSALARRPVARLCWCKSIPGGQAKPFAAMLKWYLKRRLVDAVVCTSRRQRQALLECGLARRKMPLIRNGVDLAGFESARPRHQQGADGKRLIVQVANVMPDKDHGTLLRAAGVLAKRRDDFRVLLTGRGTDSPEMALAAIEAGADSVVTLAGPRDDVPELLAAADAFVLSTRSEVFSVATLEALAAGLPVVVSDIPGFEEMFAAGREGLKVPPGDADALAGAIETLLDDAALAESLASAARRRARRFSRERMVEGFRRLVAALLRRKGIKPGNESTSQRIHESTS